MALEAGSVFVKLAGLFARDEFDKWDKATDSARAKAKDPINVPLGAKQDQLTRDLAAAQAKVDAWKHQREADVKIGADTSQLESHIRNGMTYVRDLQGQLDKVNRSNTDQEFKKIGVAVGGLGQHASETAKRSRELDKELDNIAKRGDKIRLLAPAFTAVGAAMRAAGHEGSSLERSLSRAGGGGNPGILSAAGKGFGALPWWLKAAPVIGPAALALGGSAGALVGSAGAAAAGAAGLGVGGLGVGAVGAGALFAGLKPVASDLKTAQAAWTSYEKVVAQYGPNSKQADTALKSMNAKLHDQPPLILDTIKSLDNFKDKWQNATKPAAGAGIDIVHQFTTDATKNLDSLSGIVNKTTKAFDAAAKPAINQLFGRQSINTVTSLANTFDKLLGPGLKGVVNSLQALGNVAVSTEPYLIKIDNAFLDWSKHMVAVTGDSHRMNTTMNSLVSQTHSWWELLKATGKFLVAFFGSGAKAGQGMVNSLTQILNKWTEWINQDGGRAKLQKFFEESAKATGAIFSSLGPIVKILAVLSADLMPALAKLFAEIAPVVVSILNSIAGIVNWLAQLVGHNAGLRDILGTVVAIGLAWKAISFAGQISGISALIKLYKALKVGAAEAAVAEAAAGGAGGAGAAAGALGAGAEGAAGMAAASAPELAILAAVPAILGYATYKAFDGQGNPTQIAAHQTTGRLNNRLAQSRIPGLNARQIQQLTQDTTGGTGRAAATRQGMQGHTNQAELSGFLSDASVKNVKQMVSDNNIKGLQKLAAEAHSLAKTFPEASQQLNAFGRSLDNLTKKTPSAEWNKKFNQAWNAVHDFRVHGEMDLKSITDRFQTNMRLIASTVGTNTAAGRKLAAANIKQMVGDLTKSMADGKTKVSSGMAAIKNALDQGMKKGQISWTDAWHQMFSTVTDLYKKHKIDTATYQADLRNIVSQGDKRITQDSKTALDKRLSDLKSMHSKGLLTDQQFHDDVHQAQTDANKQAGVDMQAFAAQIVGGFAETTKKGGEGLKDLISSVNSALKLLGAKPLTGLQITVMSANANAASSGNVHSTFGHQHARGGRFKFLYGGGLIPGSEFGYDDMMTIVDPTGTPRARVAGDEGILTRHQMPEVDEALALKKAMGMGNYGSLDEMWSGMTRPHGHAKGGKLKRFAGGGIVTASDFGGPGDPGTGSTGYKGDNLYQHPDSYAELNMGTALGGLPYLAPLDVTYHGKTARLLKRDIGAGGAGLSGHVRGLDLWFEAAKALGFGGLDNVMINGGQGVNVHITGGGGGGTGMSVPNITAPKVGGKNVFATATRSALGKVADAANAFLATKAPKSTGGGAGSFSFQHFSGPLPVEVQKAMQIAQYEVSRHIPYGTGEFGAYYGVNAPSMDCSGFVSTVLNAAGLDPAGHLLTGGLKSWGLPGPGKYITVGVLGADSGPTGHTMMEIANRYFESGGGGGGPHEDQGWSSNFPWKRHPPGLATGGLMSGKKRSVTVRGGKDKAIPGRPGHQPSLREFLQDKAAGITKAVGGKLGGLKRFASGGRSGSRLYTPPRTKKAKQVRVKKQPTVPAAASGLIAGFAADDATISNLESLYTRQDSIFQLYDAGGAETSSQLNTLAGIRFQEWDLLNKEYNAIPGELKKLQGALHGKDELSKKDRMYVEPGRFMKGGIDPMIASLNNQITGDEHQIDQLNLQLTDDTRAAATNKHRMSARALSQAEAIAQQYAGLQDTLQNRLDNAHAITDQIGKLSSGKKNHTQRSKLQDQRNAILKGNEAIHKSIRQLLNQKKAAAAKLKNENFDRAWELQLERWHIGDKIKKLKASIKALKVKLKAEEKLAGEYGSAIDNLYGRLTGGGDSSGAGITSNMADIGQDILALQQQGATVPQSRITAIDKLLTSLGIVLPTGGAGGAADSAAAALTEFQNFQAARANLFSSFGSNFVGAGQSAFGSPAALGAGTQDYGAAAGTGAGAGAGTGPGASGTTINIEQNYAAGPPDPHSHAVGLVHEIGAHM